MARPLARAQQTMVQVLQEIKNEVCILDLSKANLTNHGNR